MRGSWSCHLLVLSLTKQLIDVGIHMSCSGCQCVLAEQLIDLCVRIGCYGWMHVPVTICQGVNAVFFNPELGVKQGHPEALLTVPAFDVRTSQNLGRSIATDVIYTLIY